MTDLDLDHLSDEELTRLAFSPGWRWSIRVLGVTGLLAFVGMIGLFILRGADQQQQTQQNAMATVEDAFRQCTNANTSRAQLRQQVDVIKAIIDHDAPEQQADLDTLNLNPELLAAAKQAQATNRIFRGDQVTKLDAVQAALQPRNCEAERSAALQARGLPQ